MELGCEEFVGHQEVEGIAVVPKAQGERFSGIGVGGGRCSRRMRCVDWE